MEPMQVNAMIPIASNGTSGARARTTADSSWFEAMAGAWGRALDDQANRIVSRAETLTNGNESPEAITMLTAEAMRMQFLSNSSHTSLTAMGSALETMARKQ